MSYSVAHNWQMSGIATLLDKAMHDFRNEDGTKRITQARLSRLSGVPQPTISRTLKTGSIPEVETLSKLVIALAKGGVSLQVDHSSLIKNNLPADATATTPFSAPVIHDPIQEALIYISATCPDEADLLRSKLTAAQAEIKIMAKKCREQKSSDPPKTKVKLRRIG